LQQPAESIAAVIQKLAANDPNPKTTHP